MSYTPILPNPTEEHENGKKCSNWYCEKILDCNDYDNICNSSSHVHEIEHIALDCSVCDFHFSPSEKVVIFPSRLSVLPTTEMQYFYLENIAFRTGDPYPMLRAPPTQV